MSDPAKYRTREEVRQDARGARPHRAGAPARAGAAGWRREDELKAIDEEIRAHRQRRGRVRPARSRARRDRALHRCAAARLERGWRGRSISLSTRNRRVPSCSIAREVAIAIGQDVEVANFTGCSSSGSAMRTRTGCDPPCPMARSIRIRRRRTTSSLARGRLSRRAARRRLYNRLRRGMLGRAGIAPALVPSRPTGLRLYFEIDQEKYGYPLCGGGHFQDSWDWLSALKEFTSTPPGSSAR